MTPDQLRQTVLDTLAAIAPEADLSSLNPKDDVREALDLDSMDLLRFATALHDKLGVDIPEADYTRIASLSGCVEYLAARCSTSAESAARSQ
jgi:acyl carrier protein